MGCACAASGAQSRKQVFFFYLASLCPAALFKYLLQTCTCFNIAKDVYRAKTHKLSDVYYAFCFIITIIIGVWLRDKLQIFLNICDQESELGAAARCNTASPNGSLLPSSPGTPGFWWDIFFILPCSRIDTLIINLPETHHASFSLSGVNSWFIHDKCWSKFDRITEPKLFYILCF